MGFGGEDKNLYRFVGNDPANVVDLTGYSGGASIGAQALEPRLPVSKYDVRGDLMTIALLGAFGERNRQAELRVAAWTIAAYSEARALMLNYFAAGLRKQLESIKAQKVDMLNQLALEQQEQKLNAIRNQIDQLEMRIKELIEQAATIRMYIDKSYYRSPNPKPPPTMIIGPVLMS
jgi:hypothetical protein